LNQLFNFSRITCIFSDFNKGAVLVLCFTVVEEKYQTHDKNRHGHSDDRNKNIVEHVVGFGCLNEGKEL